MAMTMTRLAVSAAPILAANGVTKTFPLPGGEPRAVLEDVTVRLHPGEILALLGRSGSGKSTLLRMLAGLIPPTDGEIVSRGRPLLGPNPDVAMVFQTFALLPWKTVQENVELGLRAQGMAKDVREARALATIDMVGLDGFEHAYPRELSGGMRQRVGFARALAVRPRALLMDEPFSALDVLTAENLRGELLDLWIDGKLETEAMLIVTHNIEEAVLFADRVIVLGSDPGRIRAELPVNLSRPRDRREPVFAAMVEEIYALMTRPGQEPAAVAAHPPRVALKPLPHAAVGMIGGFLEIIDSLDRRADISAIGETLLLDVDDLMPLIDAAQQLGFAALEGGDIVLTPLGSEYARATILVSKEIFRQQARELPMLKMIVDLLEPRGERGMQRTFFAELLSRHFGPEEGPAQLETATEWGRYAELFTYDAETGLLVIDVPSGQADEPAA